MTNTERYIIDLQNGGLTPTEIQLTSKWRYFTEEQLTELFKLAKDTKYTGICFAVFNNFAKTNRRLDGKEFPLFKDADKQPNLLYINDQTKLNNAAVMSLGMSLNKLIKFPSNVATETTSAESDLLVKSRLLIGRNYKQIIATSGSREQCGRLCVDMGKN
jgi:hypothetical protein